MVKKQIIMEKSLELFAENGFEATSIQQITERCGISKGAFYLHFKSKDELIDSLIDDFMTKFVAKIERSVSEGQPKEELLYNYLNVSFSEFGQQANFAKVFLKEQIHAFNEELLNKMQGYITILNKILLSIVQRQFDQLHPSMYLDIVFATSGLMKSHAELFLIEHYKVDLHVLCSSIVEKVGIIAEHAKIQAIAPEYLSSVNIKTSYSKEQLMELLESIQQETEINSIIWESLQMLNENLQEPKLSGALIQGLLKNIKVESRCVWVAYLYQSYLENEK
ncbi:TetR/AcrR family transcriptional regulator [Lysinibacillus yapensis]|uniref:TetR/AcrR family transcriptional regulator n=1 Tax=Ureibacillus yapensis TaxID=2304605 RepID=A0A396SA89_9BACL|nr:TetR/AcrR family transcriptional regulator [Lysinibacillus yapensis]RHW36187.1 TetR/AcrR family transcriptional regulator [Lysinibacillus yapensis]